MENIGGKTWVFHCLAMRGKWEEWKTREKIFSLGPQNFFLPNWEEKQWGKTASGQFYLNALPFFFFFKVTGIFFFFFFFHFTLLNVILSLFFFFFSFHVTWTCFFPLFFFFFSLDLNFFFFSVTWAFRLQLNVFFFFPVTWSNFYIIII